MRAKDDLGDALQLLRKSTLGVSAFKHCYSGNFVNLVVLPAGFAPSEELSTLINRLLLIYVNLDGMFSTFFLLDRLLTATKDETTQRELIKQSLRAFYTHVQSILDLLAQSVRGSMPLNHVILSEPTFHCMYDFCTGKRSKPIAVAMFTQDLVDAVTACDWFEDVNRVRNAMIHRAEDFKLRKIGDVWYFYALWHDEEKSRDIPYPRRGICPDEFFERKGAPHVEVLMWMSLRAAQMLILLHRFVEPVVSYLNEMPPSSDAEDLSVGIDELRAQIEQALKRL